jgi:hypothetical protein
MNGAELFVLALLGALYPALLAVVIVVLRRPRPVHLLTFFLLGAMFVSLTIGITAVIALDPANFHASERHVNGPVYLAAGLVSLAAGAMLLDRRRARRREEHRESKEKGPSFSQRALSHDSGRLAFVLGIALDLPGLWYLIALKDIAAGGYTVAQRVLLVVVFNVIMFTVVEVPLVSYTFAPETTQRRVESFNGWLHRHGRRAVGYASIVLGSYFLGRGVAAVV